MEDIEQLRYPVGRFKKPDPITREDLDRWINEIEELPRLVRDKVNGLSDEQMSLQYRPEGWNIRQLVHHMADSHYNSFMRFKLALTEDNPLIKPYHQEAWALLPDGNKAPVETSLMILEGLHKRWTVLLRSMTPEEFKCTFRHPEREGLQYLDANVGLYAWHGKHHLAHIELACKRAGL